MSNYSLAKCMAALVILSLYTWLFGFAGELSGISEPVFADESIDFNPSEPDPVNENTAPPDSGEAAPYYSTKRIITDEPVMYYETTINAANGVKPGFADYPAQTTAQAYTGDDIDIVTSPEEETSTTAATTEIPGTTTATTTTAPVDTTTTTTPSAADAPEIPEDTSEFEATGNEGNDLEEDAEPENETAGPDDDGWEADAETLSVSVSGGTVVENTALNIISRIVQNEIGSSFHEEAIKAQAIASYTYVKLYNSNGLNGNVRLAKEASERVVENVREVLGQAVYYDGEYIQALYGASSAGYTASSLSAFGNDYPYLISRECPLDVRYDPNYGLTKSFSSSDIMTRVLSATGIELTGSPADWFEVLTLTDNVYVGSMRIGDRTTYTENGSEYAFTGKYFREDIMGLDIRSASFEIEYDEETDNFIFTTYGYGHGVGFSQNGANMLATYEGYDYRQILDFYYPGTDVY